MQPLHTCAGHPRRLASSIGFFLEAPPARIPLVEGGLPTERRAGRARPQPHILLLCLPASAPAPRNIPAPSSLPHTMRASMRPDILVGV
jgi:hypothetical protein